MYTHKESPCVLSPISCCPKDLCHGKISDVFISSVSCSIHHPTRRPSNPIPSTYSLRCDIRLRRRYLLPFGPWPSSLIFTFFTLRRPFCQHPSFRSVTFACILKHTKSLMKTTKMVHHSFPIPSRSTEQDHNQD